MLGETASLGHSFEMPITSHLLQLGSEIERNWTSMLQPKKVHVHKSVEGGNVLLCQMKLKWLFSKKQWTLKEPLTHVVHMHCQKNHAERTVSLSSVKRQKISVIPHVVYADTSFSFFFSFIFPVRFSGLQGDQNGDQEAHHLGRT